jgi:hypothetical protein
MLRQTAKLTLSRNFTSPSFDAKKKPFRGNIPTFNASISTEGISPRFFSEKGKIFAHNRRPLSEPHHRRLQIGVSDISVFRREQEEAEEKGKDEMIMRYTS